VSLRAADGTRERTFTLAAGLTAAQVVLQDRRLYVAGLAAATPDRPDRLLVYDTVTGALLHSWPLLERPTSLDVQGELALFSAQHGRGLYALRLSDGLTALVGLNRAGDAPQIETRGIVYHDDLYKGKRTNGRVFLKFIPTSVVRSRLRAIARPFLPAGRVNAFSFDGTRVGVAVGEAATGCDRLVFWNVPWRFDVELTKLLMPMKLTCPHGGGPRITDVAFAGVRLQWLATFGHVQRLLTASIVNCDIETLRSGQPGTTSLAGDENVLAYAAPGAARGVVARTQYGPTLAEGPALQVAADSGSVAVLRAGGRVEVRAADGRLVRAFHVTGARAIALRRTDLAVLTRSGKVDVFDTASGARTHAWRVPAGAAAIDVHYGIAVLPVGRRVFALDLDTGRTAVLAQSPAEMKAQIEARGVVYAYNVRRRGFLRYVPTAKVEAALGR